MRELWKVEVEGLDKMAALDDGFVLSTPTSVCAFDSTGSQLWHYPCRLPPRQLVAASGQVVVAMSGRGTPSDIVGLNGTTGRESWRYRRTWGLIHESLSADAGEVIISGQDFGVGADPQRWVVLDLKRGVVLADVRPPERAGRARFAGKACLAQIDDGEGGLLRTDRRGSGPTVITETPHIAFASAGEMVVLDTSEVHPRGEVVAVDMEGSERWRGTSGVNIGMGVEGGRVAYVDGDRRPTVVEVATGRELWRGAPLPPIDPDNGFRCLLERRALVCYGGSRHVSVYSLPAGAPIVHRELDRDDAHASFVAGPRYYAVAHDRVAVWEVDGAAASPHGAEEGAPRASCPEAGDADPRVRGADAHAEGASWSDGYVVAVADCLRFSFGQEWDLLAGYDSSVRREAFAEALASLAGMGVRPSFGDGEEPSCPPAAAPHIAALREQLRRLASIAPRAFAGPRDIFARILCTDPWPRIYTTAALDVPPESPVHVVQASDLMSNPGEWARLGELARFRDLRALVMFCAPLRDQRLPLDLKAFPHLEYLDVSESGLEPEAVATIRTQLRPGCVVAA